MPVIKMIILLGLSLASVASGAVNPPAPYGPVPTVRQLRWHQLEFYGFLHFKVTTSRIRLRITQSPVCPAISEVAVFAEPGSSTP